MRSNFFGCIFLINHHLLLVSQTRIIYCNEPASTEYYSIHDINVMLDIYLHRWGHWTSWLGEIRVSCRSNLCNLAARLILVLPSKHCGSGVSILNSFSETGSASRVIDCAISLQDTESGRLPPPRLKSLMVIIWEAAWHAGYPLVIFCLAKGDMIAIKFVASDPA